MTIELSLVRTASINGTEFDFIARSRYAVENEEALKASIVAFIKNNFAHIKAKLGDSPLAVNLETLTTITTPEFYSLKYLLANEGLDILLWGVSDNEINADIVSEGISEYNFVDSNFMLLDTVPLCTKMNFPKEDDRLGEAYNKMNEIYGLFRGDLFEGTQSPLDLQMQSIAEFSAVTGTFPRSVSEHVRDIFAYCNKKIFIINN